MKGKSLTGSDEQIKINALIVAHKRTGVSIGDICLVNTGMTLYEYLERPFNRLMYGQYLRQQLRWKNPVIKFWEL